MKKVALQKISVGSFTGLETHAVSRFMFAYIAASMALSPALLTTEVCLKKKKKKTYQVTDSKLN